jgi:hypothetical protein
MGLKGNNVESHGEDAIIAFLSGAAPVPVIQRIPAQQPFG